MCDNLGVSLPHVKAGRIKALAVASAKRVPSLPDVPALAEGTHDGGDDDYDDRYDPRYGNGNDSRYDDDGRDSANGPDDDGEDEAPVKKPKKKHRAPAAEEEFQGDGDADGGEPVDMDE